MELGQRRKTGPALRDEQFKGLKVSMLTEPAHFREMSQPKFYIIRNCKIHTEFVYKANKLFY